MKSMLCHYAGCYFISMGTTDVAVNLIYERVTTKEAQTKASIKEMKGITNVLCFTSNLRTFNKEKRKDEQALTNSTRSLLQATFWSIITIKFSMGISYFHYVDGANKKGQVCDLQLLIIASHALKKSILMLVLWIPLPDLMCLFIAVVIQFHNTSCVCW